MDNSPSVEKKSLDKVPLDDLAKGWHCFLMILFFNFNSIFSVLNISLKNNFEYVNVEVVDCPDLTKQPFTLAKPGLDGNTKLIELGGVPYLLPTVKREKVYDLKNIAATVKSNPTFIIGAGAGPHPYAKTNCEVCLRNFPIFFFTIYLNLGNF